MQIHLHSLPHHVARDGEEPERGEVEAESRT